MDELEALQSIYFKEIIMTESNLLNADINKQSLRFDFQYITNLNNSFDATFDIDASYPLYTYPTVLIRALLDRQRSLNLNSDLNNYIRSLSLGEPILNSIINWLIDNIDQYFTIKTNSDHSVEKVPSMSSLSRLWIYSHHIYNIKKRKKVIDTARNLDLCGFSSPGKPGIICVEGCLDAVQEFWKIIRNLSWQKISIKHEETIGTDNKAFADFQELIFSSGVHNHLDTSSLYEFLTLKNLNHSFAYLFDLDI